MKKNLSILIAIFMFVAVSGCRGEKKKTTTARPVISTDEIITISYGGMIDPEILTHTGESVGEVIKKIQRSSDELKGLVQPYLEPFSILCNDALMAIKKPDEVPLVNILTHYPVGSEQPAWVALFQEGHYQLYYNKDLIRLFIKGTNPSVALENHRSVIRHAVKDVLSSPNISIKTIEVYAFENDYSATELRLNIVPIVKSVRDFDLSPKGKSINLSSIESLLNEGVIIEAVEVDTNKEMFFYGRKASNQTIAGAPLSLSDIAVIYRSIFHDGYNSAYISLDKNEDNRYAKVNFGGHFENTRVGNVVLEADKLFKLLSTGIDPNIHKIIREDVSANVPDFLTEDERSLMEQSEAGHVQIRYWFYPDEIGTETDGSIGVVSSNQFLADVERMDVKVSVGNAVRETIDHLNNNYGQYEKAFTTFKELGTVGRIMSLIIWLKNMNEGIDLDEFLSVKLPAFKTPAKTKKMLAITAFSFQKDTEASASDVRKYSKVYYISDLLDKQSADATDNDLLAVAKDYYSKMDDSAIAPKGYNEMKSKIANYKRLIKEDDEKLNFLEKRIDKEERLIDSDGSYSVTNHNSLVNQYNSIIKKRKTHVEELNTLIDQFNDTEISNRYISSVGGGINLRPDSFKPVARVENSPKIKQISMVKLNLKNSGNISIDKDWVRSNAGKSEARINKLQTVSWKVTDSVEVSGKKLVQSGEDKNFISMNKSSDGKNWQSDISLNGSRDTVKFDSGAKTFSVYHSTLAVRGRGKISPSGKEITFTKEAI